MDPAKGLRVLVHLDKALGKNDGTVSGQSYCTEPLGPNEGVLVRADKVGKLSAEMEDEITAALASILRIGSDTYVVLLLIDAAPLLPLIGTAPLL